MSASFSGEFEHGKLKDDFRNFLRNQNTFKGYNFDGTNFDILFDVLAYNTNLNTFMHNMVIGEASLQSAQLRENALLAVRPLNYVARSYQSAKAVINIEVLVSDPNLQSITIPAGFAFNGAINGAVYQFQTLESYTINRIADRFQLKNVMIAEGKSVRELYLVRDSNTRQSFVISNTRVDTNTLKVNVLDTSTAVVKSLYKRADNLYDLDETSKVYFLQNTYGDKYEIVFGDNIFGQKLKVNNVVEATYYVVSGEVANGVNAFTAADKLNNYRVVATTIQPAENGSAFEDIDSIKQTAPRYFQAQERAIIPEDYAALIKKEFNEIGDINVFGGETLSEPQYGKIFISAVTTRGNPLSDTRKQEVLAYLQDKKVPNMRISFIDPELLQIALNATVRYDPNNTSLSSDSLKSKIITAISNFSLSNFNRYNSVMRYSKLVEFIDSIDPAIVSNETRLTLAKTVSIPSYYSQLIRVDFKNELANNGDYNVQTSPYSINSTVYTSRDNGKGVLRLYSPQTDELSTEVTGSVNYSTGVVILNSNSRILYDRELLTVYATPRSLDIKADQNTILQFNLALSNITVKSV